MGNSNEQGFGVLAKKSDLNQQVQGLLNNDH